MEKKENTRKAAPPKDRPVKIIVVPVYVGDKKMSDVFFELIYKDLLAKSA